MFHDELKSNKKFYRCGTKSHGSYCKDEDNISGENVEDKSCSWITSLQKSKLTSPLGAEIRMQFAELFIAPGHTREVHWHINSGEWGYVKGGKCGFTLMDSTGNSKRIEVIKDDVWYFPAGWQHSIEAFDRTVECNVLLWFDSGDANIDLTNTIAKLPDQIVSDSLGGIEDLKTLKHPYDVCRGDNSATGVIPPKNPDSASKPEYAEYPWKPCLEPCPAFRIKSESNEVEVLKDNPAGTEYDAKIEQFPGSLTMAGALLVLQKDAIREIHWHPNAEEQHYVLEGKVTVTVYGVDANKETKLETYTIGKGELGVVPRNFIHYIKAEMYSELVIAFNSPSWETQTLSQTTTSTPNNIEASTFNVDEGIIDQYFPKKPVGIFFPSPSPTSK